MQENERAYSLKETKNLLGGIGNEKLYQLLNSGQLRGRKMGNRTFVLASDLRQFLDNLPEYHAT